jgi:hypothetical protein
MTVESSPRSKSGRFQKGHSGNPAGKLKGTPNKTTALAQQLIDSEAETLVRKLIELAKAGDLTCLRICLERLVPPKKSPPMEIALPQVNAVADIPKLFAALSTKVGEGAITTSEVGVLIDLAESTRRSLEAVEFEQRISALEQKTQPRVYGEV